MTLAATGLQTQLERLQADPAGAFGLKPSNGLISKDDIIGLDAKETGPRTDISLLYTALHLHGTTDELIVRQSLRSLPTLVGHLEPLIANVMGYCDMEMQAGSQGWDHGGSVGAMYDGKPPHPRNTVSIANK